MGELTHIRDAMLDLCDDIEGRMPDLAAMMRVAVESHDKRSPWDQATHHEQWLREDVAAGVISGRGADRFRGMRGC